MDNVIFQVNGRGSERLKAAISLAMTDEYGRSCTVGGVARTENGLELYFYSCPEGVAKLPVALDVDAVYSIARLYLDDDKAIKEVWLGTWETACAGGDVHDTQGWCVSTGDWGRVRGCRGIAVKPVYCWYGK